jgi:hypothetical protein
MIQGAQGYKPVVTAHNNDEQYMGSKRERSRERDTQI